MIRRLLLWDVDGTLLKAGELGAAVFDVALETVLGRRPTGRPRMSGKTDPQIVREYLAEMARLGEMGELAGAPGVADGPDGAGGADGADAAALALMTATAASGLETDTVIQQVLDHSHRLLAEAAATGHLRAGGTACPGIADVLAELAADPRVLSTLLTGNIAPNALVKVAAFGLDPWLDLTVGAYGSDAIDRNLLVPIALRRLSSRRGVDLAPEDAWVIGDTPRDLECARAAGARCLLVATGRFGLEELADLEPDAVLEDLSDTPAVVKLLTMDV